MDRVGPSQWILLGQATNDRQKIILQLYDAEKFPVLLKPLKPCQVNSSILGIFPVLAAKGRTYLSITDFRNATPIGARQNFTDPMCPWLLTVVFNQCARIEIDQRRSSIMMRERGVPLTLMGGDLRLKRPFFKGSRILPCFAKTASRSSTVT